jgi:O-Antigen ligase
VAATDTDIARIQATGDTKERFRRLTTKIGRVACVLAILLASGDLWPTVTVGFTFRFSQLCIFIAIILLPSVLRERRFHLFPGWRWITAFLVWIVITLPISLFIPRSVGYAFWAWMDVFILFVFPQYFVTEADAWRLIRLYMISFLTFAIFGLVQFVLGMLGLSLLIIEWWVPGRLPRVNALSYEPSYYATYMVAGWVFAAYLLEKKATLPSRSLQKATLYTSSVALFLCTSRIGWVMVALWFLFRGSLAAARVVARGTIRKSHLAYFLAFCLMIGALFQVSEQLAGTARAVATQLSFLVEGLGIFGASSHSADQRTDDFTSTVDAFTAHPLTGTGIGAVSVHVASLHDVAVNSVADAKRNEGISIFAELAASTGIVGSLLVICFAGAVTIQLKNTKKIVAPANRTALEGLAWSVIWLLLALQLNQNFLRVYIFTDLAVLICCIISFRHSVTNPQPS